MANPFFVTPRTRRLSRDLSDMKQLAEESSIVSFQASGDAPSEYLIRFDGKGLGENERVINVHKIQITMGMEYPRSLPSIRWETPIMHPNINGGNPCFGTFVMNPNVRLVDLVEILWDMARLSTYNPYGGYGDKDRWQVLRKKMDFPIDKRILRDKVAAPQKSGPEDGGEDLIIMGGFSLGALPPSRIWVKMALEQYFESRGLFGQVKVYTADEWFAETHEAVPNMIGVIQMDQLIELTKSGPEENLEFANDLKAFLKELRVRAEQGDAPGVLYIFGREG